MAPNDRPRNMANDIIGLIREDTTSIQIAYTFAFNSNTATSTFVVSLNLAVGHK